MQQYRTFIPEGVIPGLCQGSGSDTNSQPDAEGDSRALKRLQKIGLLQKYGTVFETRYFEDAEGWDTPKGQQKALAFVSAVLMSVKKYGGIMLTTSPSVCVATWNAHNVSPTHAYSACCAALEVKDLAAKGNLKLCTSIVTGDLMAGSVGDSNTRAVAASGGAVEFCRRLADLSTFLGSSVLVSETTYRQVASKIDAWAVDKVSVEPGNTVVELYELKGRRRDRGHGDGEEREQYSAAWAVFCKGNYEAAADMMGRVRERGSREHRQQVNRLLNLSHYFSQRKDDEPNSLPYVRRSRPEWEDFEVQGSHRWPLADNPSTAVSYTSQGTADDAQNLEDLLLQVNDEPPLFVGGGSPLTTVHPLAESCHATINPSCNDSFDPTKVLDSVCTSVDFESEDLPRVFPTTKRELLYSSGLVLGEGSYGKVYVGMTPDGELVALKSLARPDNLQSVQDLITEVCMLLFTHIFTAATQQQYRCQFLVLLGTSTSSRTTAPRSSTPASSSAWNICPAAAWRPSWGNLGLSASPHSAGTLWTCSWDLNSYME